MRMLLAAKKDSLAHGPPKPDSPTAPTDAANPATSTASSSSSLAVETEQVRVSLPGFRALPPFQRGASGEISGSAPHPRRAAFGTSTGLLIKSSEKMPPPIKQLPPPMTLSLAPLPPPLTATSPTPPEHSI